MTRKISRALGSGCFARSEHDEDRDRTCIPVMLFAGSTRVLRGVQECDASSQECSRTGSSGVCDGIKWGSAPKFATCERLDLCGRSKLPIGV